VDGKITVTVGQGEMDDGNNFVDISMSDFPSLVPSMTPSIAPIFTKPPTLPPSAFCKEVALPDCTLCEPYRSLGTFLAECFTL
jgi:hypothetical protein